MSGKIFQPAIAEMKESALRALGVIDEAGNVVACTIPSRVGGRMAEAAAELEEKDSFASGGFSFRALRTASARAEYAAFAQGEDALAAGLCIMAAAGLNSAKDYYDEKHDRATFVKHIILNNVLPGDIYMKSRELGIEGQGLRALFLIKQTGDADSAVVDILKNLFPDRRNDFVISLGERETAFVKSVGEETGVAELEKMARAIGDTLRGELMVSSVIGIGSVCRQIRDLAGAYKEAQVAIEVGKVFDTAKTVVTYENLGLGRLIYQLPTTMCEMYLTEVFKKNNIDALDRETLETIISFFDNSLNISETSRKLFVHRNTLVYRLEKIKKLTGLDLREFDQAVVFKVALMVYRYLNSTGAAQGGALP